MASNENLSMESELFGEICMNPEILKIDDTVVVETDGEKCAKFSEILHQAKSGDDIIESLKILSDSGQKLILSLQVKRIMKIVEPLELINQQESSSRWGNESKSFELKNFKEKIEKSIIDLRFGSTQWSAH